MTGSNSPSGRRPGLQGRWAYVVKSIESIMPIYEEGSSRIALFGDGRMRRSVIRFAVSKSSLVLDLGCGPGTMARLVDEAGGYPVLLDASRKMLSLCPGHERVQSVFEYLPFRKGSFDSVVAGFALRDARDLLSAVKQVRYVLGDEGMFGFCDLGKPDRPLSRVMIALYLRAVVPFIGLLSGGRRGLAFKSLYDTYVLTLKNSELVSLLRRFFEDVQLDATRGGGAIVVRCVAGREPHTPEFGRRFEEGRAVLLHRRGREA